MALVTALGLAIVSACLLVPPPGAFRALGGPDEALGIGGGEAAPADSAVIPASTDHPPPEAVEHLLPIGRNQSFYDALRAAGAPHDDIMALVRACKPFRNLRRVRRDEEFRIAQDADGRVLSLSFDLDLESYLTMQRRGDSFEILERTHPVEHRICAASGTIRRTLYESVIDAGAPVSLAPKMNDVLGWAIDFNRDLRPGDSFRVLYEEIWRDGQFVRTGPILAMECDAKGRPHLAFRYTVGSGSPGYYDQDGRNLQKALMRAPLEYSRISSGYSSRRFHPILKRTMPHLGIDYAAPVGTPVWAAGDGTVVFAGTKQGNGRYVELRHGNGRFRTYYLHLSRFGKGIRAGASVKQGQVIGYVGATGYATGPHLDYRMKKDDRFVDPRRVDLPPADPIPEAELATYRTLADLYAMSLADLASETGPHRVALAYASNPPLWEPFSPTVPLPAGRLSGSAAPAR